MQINHIYNNNCIEILNNVIEPNSIQLIFADPPYNLSGKKLNLENNKTGGAFFKVNENWDKFTEEEYDDFTYKWITACNKVLKDNGSLYISCTMHNIAIILNIAKKIGFKLNNIITWYKPNSMPNITKRTFTHSTEFVCWLAKGKNWIFNYEAIKKINPLKTIDGQDKQMRDFIEIPILQGKERLKNKDNKAAHPTQKPEKLLEVMITASSNEGDIILDPFFGTGTTGAVAKKLNRNWIGIEINPVYCEISKNRLKDEQNLFI